MNTTYRPAKPTPAAKAAAHAFYRAAGGEQGMSKKTKGTVVVNPNFKNDSEFQAWADDALASKKPNLEMQRATPAAKAAAHAFYRAAGDDLPMDKLEAEMHGMFAKHEAAQEAKAFLTDPDMQAHSDAQHADMAGRLDYGAAVVYMLGGNATFTLRSLKTGARYTYRMRRADGDLPNRPWFVSLMNGPDNEHNFAFIGTLWSNTEGHTFRTSPKAKVGWDAPSAKAIRWFIQQTLTGKANVMDSVECWHEGRCGRCGRKLTVPESVANGFGPECVKHL
jgi:hypothetical protein